MKESLLKQYKFEIIFFFSFSAVMMVIATFWDLQIDLLLNKSNSFIAMWFDKTGEMPASLLTTIALAFIVKCSEKMWIKILGFFATLVAGAFFGIWFGERLFTDNLYQTFFNVVFGVGFAMTVLFVLQFIVIHEKIRKPLIIIAVLGLLVSGAETLIVTGLKDLWGRVRFRSLERDFSNFTPWYVINTSQRAHSFPSGHTADAGMSYLLMLLPFVSEKCKEYKLALFSISFFYTNFVAVTRMMMGAHYLSDVVVGSLISFSLVLAAIALYENVAEKKLLNK
ncbi:MAG: phosphatase PAP2 family protein [Clostridia bacterium]|nr:phosphatase PAP2 family protein [Clostridia bacterium]